ncbi:MAG: radical SAM family heme chaperone HemW [Vicinamibacterales bacterium]
MTRPPREPIGIYIHIPFCGSICDYCNFNRSLHDAGERVRYVEALTRDIARVSDLARADTVYFGGGTPSLLERDELTRIVCACRDTLRIAPDAEVTLEVNPETIAPDACEGWREAGITRLSIGVQSFDDAELARLGRRHSARTAKEGVAVVRAAGFDNISLDLMMWLPAQTVDAWLQNVDALIALEPDHASLYLLEVYPNAPLRDTMARAHWAQAPDDDAAEMYERAMERLADAGLQQYEISNVARAGREARHNLKYWSDGEWLAFGCGAHGTRDDVRWRNVTGTDDYIRRVAAGESVRADSRRLTPGERLQEALFMGLRLTRGVDLGAIAARYGVDVWEQYGEALFPYVESGHVRYDGTRLHLTRAGMLVANEILSVFV